MIIQTKEEHWYESKVTPGLYYPSVTTILQEYPKGKFFEKYLSNLSGEEEAKSILEEAGKRGTRVHEASELLEEGKELRLEDYSVQEWLLIKGFVDWYKENRPVTKQVEYKVVSDEMRTGGTIDRIYILDGKLTVFDLKTSKSAIHDSYWLQLAAYAEMYENLHDVVIEQVAILRMTPQRKSGYEFVTHTRDEWKRDLYDFYHIQAIWDRKHPKADPGFLEVPDTLSLQ